jgi:hypothetical protein
MRHHYPQITFIHRVVPSILGFNRRFLALFIDSLGVG